MKDEGDGLPPIVGAQTFMESGEWDHHRAQVEEVFRHDEELQCLYINMTKLKTGIGGSVGEFHEYEVDLEKINSQADLLDWVEHLVDKPWLSWDASKWQSMMLKELIHRILKIKGWKLNSWK